MPRCGLFVGSLALSLGEVVSVRQRLETSSTVHAVQAISALLQERNMGNDALLHQISDFASAAVTPGAADAFDNSLKVVANDIETQIEKKIKEAQAATQGKIESLFKGLQDANTAVDTAKTAAVSSDKTWFECAADEQAKRQAAEAADKGLTDSRSNENEACQLQQDNKGFAFDATGKYKLDFDCDHSVAGNCAAALKTYQEKVLQKMFADAEAALAEEETNYNSMEASCDAKKQERVQAQSSLDSADSAWSTQRAACAKLAPQRESSMCAFGTQAQAKCSAEVEFTKLVAATQQAKGDADSEVDRENEWLASRSTKCMITKAMQKGLDGAVAGADLDACAAQVNFAQDVVKLNTKQAEFTKLSRTNACVNGAISFFNGQTWNVPTGAKPSSKSYTRTKFSPQLDPTSSNFDFCSAPPAPGPQQPDVQPDVESRPTTKTKCDIYVGDAGKTLGGESHSVVMALDFTDSKENDHKRQWILNIGQQGTGAEHWLWHPASGGIQMGMWNGPQIRGVDISKAKHTLATVYDATSKTYSLYVDGKLAKTRGDFTLNIKNSVLSAGDKQGYSNEANFNGCVSGVDLYYRALTAEQMHAASAKLQGI